MDMFTMFTSYGHNQIIRSQNKITDFFMILAWACPSISLYGKSDHASTLSGELSFTCQQFSNLKAWNFVV